MHIFHWVIRFKTLAYYSERERENYNLKIFNDCTSAHNQCTPDITAHFISESEPLGLRHTRIFNQLSYKMVRI